MEEEVKKKKKNRDRIGVVLYIFYIVLLAMSALVVAKILWIQVFFKPDKGLAKVLTPSNVCQKIEPARGNIIDCEGRLLAMSTPNYQIAMDCTVRRDEFARDKKEGAQKEEAWLAKARQLSYELERIFPEKTADQYYNMIREGRKNGKKYLKFGKPVDRKTYNEVVTFPLFNEGRYKGGLSVEQSSVRTYPYGSLARRTIGFVRDNKSDVGNTHVGLEGKFDYILHGVNGKEWLRVTDMGRVRNNDSTYVKAEDGKDIRTTINIDYQDIADRALREQIAEEEDIEGATLVLMEVKTGAIRAMVNLMKPKGGNSFEELTNYAIGRTAEPGSVFKTVTLLSVLNDGGIKSLDETLPTNHGVIPNSGLKQDIHIVDHERMDHITEMSVIDGFKISSNYIFGKLAIDNYGKKPEKFIQEINSYKLGEAFDFDLEGLATPYIPTAGKNFHMSTLGTMGFGYSTEETPLHILTFYNAIANKGRMMKPYLVEDVEENGIVKEKRGPSILNSAICSHAIADTMTRALKAVTEEGTAKALKKAKVAVAGKTGTSFGTFPAAERGRTPYEDKYGAKKYQGTFVGYFPADDPQYSVICMVYSNPTHKQFQGGGIPARAIKTLVNELWCIDPYFRTSLTKKTTK